MDKTNGQLTSLGSTSPAAAFALFRQDPSDEYSAAVSMNRAEEGEKENEKDRWRSACTINESL